MTADIMVKAMEECDRLTECGIPHTYLEILALYMEA